ncbi:MAG: dTMP kinase [Moraxella sp.]|nr:dTMP kinase [Moraxella sp.]
MSSTLAFDAPQFITFEGTEGVGKTTAIDGFCDRLSECGIDFVRTREPGGSTLAEDLRKILLDNNTDINTDTELLLIFTARADHLHRTILPALAQGKWVICDRFIDSTVAYQGYGRYWGDERELAKIALLIEQFVPRLPDITLWLDLDVRTGMARAGKRGTADRFEAEDVAFFERIYQGFAKQSAQHARIRRIDADGTVQEVQDRIWTGVFD